MKCPACGTDNPDYVFFCGKCGTDLKAKSQPATTPPRREAMVIPRAERALQGTPVEEPPRSSIEEVLTANLSRIDENLVRERISFVGKFRGALRKPGILLAFKSETEVVSLGIGEDGHAYVSREWPSGKVVVLVGSQAAFLGMFDDGQFKGDLPESIGIRLVDQTLPETIDAVFRYEVERLLRSLLQ